MTGRGFDSATDNSIGYLLRDNSRLILSALAARLEALGITLPQYFVLRELWREEGLTQRQLANRVGVLEPTMVTTLDALERAGTILRVRSTTDRRKMHVQLSGAGRTLRDELHGYAGDVLDRALAGISDDEVVTLRGILQRMKKNLERT
jgi:DNA-binding MarR family transcriptional regulator